MTLDNERLTKENKLLRDLLQRWRDLPNQPNAFSVESDEEDQAAFKAWEPIALQLWKDTEAALAAASAPAAVPAPTTAWPAGCSHPNSCARHQRCMYLGCVNEHRDIAAEITLATALRTQPGSDAESD